MFSNLRGSEWIILLLIVVLLFGARRLPDAARGLGRSLRIFKAETKGLTDSEPATDTKSVDGAQEMPTVQHTEQPAPEASKQTPTQP